MEIFNIGAPELILILLIMLIVLGPDQMVANMKSLARFVRKVVRSPLWAEILNTSREIKDLPTKMLRETGIEEDMAEMNRTIHLASKDGLISPNIKESTVEKIKPEETSPEQSSPEK
jgi:sec-independent protein translocase protein TatB